MSTRRDFLTTTVGLFGAAAPLIGRSQGVPCAPAQLIVDSTSFSQTCVRSTAPAYIASMAPYQVRSLAGTYAPTNGTSTLRSIMPSMWGSNDDIMRPWSGGAKSTTGTRMYVHGGGHSDSSNNSLTSFDFAGDARPTGWILESAGQTGVSGDFGVGTTGYPVSVHTYDGMVDMETALFRFGGSAYPSGSFSTQAVRFDKATGAWTRLPSWPGGGFGGMALGSPAAGKILIMDRWVSFNTYAFYRLSSNSWSSIRTAAQQWNSDGVVAFNPTNGTGLVIGNNGYSANAFSIAINWTAETITQTVRALPDFGPGASLAWDPTRRCYWCFGATANTRTLYQIDPTDFSVVAHALTGDVPLTPEAGGTGSFGRFVFMDGWRAIGSVASRTSPAFVIRLP